MSNNNNDGGAAMGFAMVGAFFLFAMIIMYAIACFVAVIYTILSLLAWDKPLRVFGQEIFSPDVARLYMYSALGGMWGVAAFVAFCSLLFQESVPEEWWFYIFTGGYSFTPWVIIAFLSDEALGSTKTNTSPSVINHVPPALPPAPQPFVYASWNDEVGVETQAPQKPKCNACMSLATYDPDAPVYRR